jgi:hypothetical protein
MWHPRNFSKLAFKVLETWTTSINFQKWTFYNIHFLGWENIAYWHLQLLHLNNQRIHHNLENWGTYQIENCRWWNKWEVQSRTFHVMHSCIDLSFTICKRWITIQKHIFMWTRPPFMPPYVAHHIAF